MNTEQAQINSDELLELRSLPSVCNRAMSAATSTDLAVENISFCNSHEIAYALAHQDPEAAKALLAELKYWLPNA